MKKQEGKSHKVMILIFLIILMLFQNFVWNVYVVNPTVSDALDKEKGEQGVITKIDKKQSFGILKLADGFHAYAISKGFWGWSITDDTYISNESTDKPFNAKKETFQYKNNKEVDVILIATNDADVSKLIAYDENKKEIGLWKVPYNGLNLYYAYSRKPIADNITIEAYSANEELLYQE